MPENRRLALFPPRDFIPTSFIFGFWAGGVMAGMNYIRLGYRERGRRLIALSILAQVAFWTGPLAVTWSVSLSAPPLATPADLGIGALVFAVNLAVALWLFQAQHGLYRQWVAQLLPSAKKTPYLERWVSLLAIVGAAVVIFLVGVLYVSLS